MVTVYEAINKAADLIERNPERLNFMQGMIFNGMPVGCPLAWIGVESERYLDGVNGHCNVALDYLGLPDEVYGSSDVLLRGQFSARRFYDRMDILGYGWRYNAAACAKNLRAYAEKYHGVERMAEVVPVAAATETRRVGIPGFIKSLFTRKENEVECN